MATLWVRSYFVGEVILLPSTFTKAHPQFGAIVSSHGYLRLLDSNFVDDFGFFGEHTIPPGSRIINGMVIPKDGITGVPFSEYRPEAHMLCGILIQNYQRTDAYGSSLINRACAADRRTFGVPDWLLMILGIFPLIPTLIRWHRTRTRPTGLCPACNYDLRATPTRCPECGLQFNQ